MGEDQSTGSKYLTVVRKRIDQLKSQGEQALNQLDDDEIHWTYNEESNSVSVIVKHLSGNMRSRWTDFLKTDGEKPDRNRDAEFEDSIASKAELLKVWEEGWVVFRETIYHLTETDLLKTVRIRGEKLGVIDAIERQLVHYSSHIGQILYVGKQIKGEKWQTLSIPRGKSEEFLQSMKQKHEGK